MTQFGRQNECVFCLSSAVSSSLVACGQGHINRRSKYIAHTGAYGAPSGPPMRCKI